MTNETDFFPRVTQIIYEYQFFSLLFLWKICRFFFLLDTHAHTYMKGEKNTIVNGIKILNKKHVLFVMPIVYKEEAFS